MNGQLPQRSAADDTGAEWDTLYRAGGVSAFVFVLLVLVPIVLVFAAPVPPADGAGVLVYISEHRWVYLVELICFVGLSVPAIIVFCALAVALRGVDRSVALLGGVIGVVSETIALALGSSPQSLHGGLVVLGNAYARADDTGRPALVSAAEALIAATNAVSWAGILTAAGIGVLSLLMRRGGFGTGLAVLGVLAGVLGVMFEVTRPMIGAWYSVYGLLLPVWFGLVGWRLLRRPNPPVAESIRL